MLLDQINMNYLRIFEAVYRTRSMTQAASEMHLTQSGISQHIKSLEDTLDLQLFDRIKQKLVPTEDGKRLYEQLSPHLQRLEEILLDLTNKENSLRGEISIGMPVVFGLNILLPHIAELGKMHPLLKFKIHFDIPRRFNNMLLRGDLDFAFVDEYNMDNQITTELVYDETLRLCCSTQYIKEKGEGSSKKYYEGLEYVDYDQGNLLLSRWFEHHYKINKIDLQVRAVLGDTLGIAKLIKFGLGAGILPEHQLERLKTEGYNLHVIEGKNNKPLKNKINVAYVKGRSWSTSVHESFNFLMKKIKETR
ncbi:MAG: LysR family transcriptional regulator [Bdellovibrionaceae bacterium]|nr:LysR family transcriptional regulator [Pseudobdellovibrionaceae bacterium]